MAKKNLEESSRKKSDIKGTILLVAILAVLAAVLVGQRVVEPVLKRREEQNPKGEQQALQIGETDLLVEVRTSPEGMSKGLSYRKSLGDNEGMVFIYQEDQQPLFWMKDMHFDIDIVWINDGEVVEIDRQVRAPTEEEPRIQTAIPQVPVDMVLEVNAGWADERGVEVGDMVEFR